jgi:tetratricopeptide (TPR) repeat protein
MAVVSASFVDDLVARIEENPLEPRAWRAWAKSVPADDSERARSLEVIIAGLEELRKNTQHALAKNERAPASSPLAAPLFARLAHDCNDPRLLKEAGMIYLSTWRLPDVARRHFERCLKLGEAERDVRPLLEAAALSSQRLAAARTGQKPEGVIGAPSFTPVSDKIRRTSVASPAILPGASLPLPMLRPLGETPLPKSGLECLREAAAMIAQGRLARAQELLLRAGDNPRQGREIAQAWASLGKAHYETGDFAAMELAYQEASKSEPETMVAHFNLALAKQLNGKMEQAEALYLTAERIQPHHPKILCNLGSLYLQSKRPVDAEKALRSALQADPHYARAWDNLAAALEAQGRLAEAVEACQRAIEARPGYAEAYQRLGVIQFERSRAAEASEAFRHASSAPATAPASFAYLAIIHARLSQLDAAGAAVLRAAELNAPTDLLWTAWNELGKARYVRSRYVGAAEAFAKATAVRADEAEGWFNLGLAWHMAGAREQAREGYRRAVELDPDFTLAWHNLGLACTEAGQHGEAVAAFQADVRLEPDNARAWYDLGINLEAEGRKVEASQAFLRAEALEQALSAPAHARAA